MPIFKIWQKDLTNYVKLQKMQNNTVIMIMIIQFMAIITILRPIKQLIKSIKLIKNLRIKLVFFSFLVKID